MTITIASTLSIRIPNNQLILPDLVLDQNGNQQFNSSDVEVMLDALDGDNPSNIPKLGRQFFTSAYLTVNQDAGDFALWQANPTDAVHLLAIKDPTCQTGSSNGSISTNSTHPSTPPGNKDVPVSKTAKSKDTIIAAVACGCATILLALASIFFCGYRRRKQTGAESLYSENNGDLPLQEMEGYSLKRELDAGVDIQELSSSTGQSALNELPGSPVRKKDML